MNGYDPAALIPPADNEIEFSLFGPGFGECAVCHLGNSDWLIVDSCLDPYTRVPVALQYLERLGVTPATAVTTVVATHWHDDHIQGMAEVLKSIPSAQFAITAAFDKADFRAALAPWMDGGSGLDGKGFAELRRIIQLKRVPILTGENKIIFDRYKTPRCMVKGLSPSDPASLACISELLGIPKTQFATRFPSIRGNHASVVLSIEVEDRHLLLGGDLQVRADRKFGWLAVVDSHLKSGRPRHHVYKIPHHGSANGDHAEIWEHVLEKQPHAILAPFVGGKTKLPTADDVARIKSFTSNVSITALPTPGKFNHPRREVEKTMKAASRSLETIPHQFGHVRLRGRLNYPPDQWKVEHFGDAKPL